MRGRSFRVPLLLAPALVCVAAAGSTAPPPGPGGEPADAAAVRPLIGDARWTEAEAAARDLVARRAAADGEDSPGYAAALDLLLEVLVRSGRWSEPATKEMAARAVAINEQALGPDAPALATSLIRLGSIERLAGPPQHARQVLERALAIRQAAFGENSLPVAEALWQVAWSVAETGDPQQGIAMHERALAIRESLLGRDDLLVADSLAGLGGVARNAGDFQKAEAAHERALGIRRRHLRSDHPDVALSAFSVADAKHRLGDFGGALPLYEESLRIRENAPWPDPRLGETLIYLGDLLTALGSLDRARPMYERGVRIWDEMLGDGVFFTGIGHQSYAQFLEAAGDGAGARREFERAIAIFDRALPPPHPLRAVGRQDLGLMLKRQGDLDAARDALQASLDIWHMQPGALSHPFSAEPLMALGAILRDQGDAAAAGPLLDQAVAIFESSYGTGHPSYAEALLERSRLAFRKGNDDAALEDALRAEESLRENLRTTTRALSESEALRYQEVMISGLDTAFSILIGAGEAPAAATRTRAVFEALGRSRTLVLDEIAARHRSITRSDDPRIRGLDEALVAARQNYARLLVGDRGTRISGRYAPLLQGARETMEQAERDLAAASAAFAEVRQRLSMTYAEVARTLPERSALVSYVAYLRSDRSTGSGKGTPSYLAFAVAPGAAAPVAVPLGAAAGIDAAIDRWRNESSKPPAGHAAEESYRVAAQAVRVALWDPVEGRLGGVRRVVVVPDAAIHALSFATLVDRGGRYLVETGPEFHYVSAERDLFSGAGDAAAPRGSGLLALGGPDFDAAPVGGKAGPPANGRPTPDPVQPGIRLRAVEVPCADALTFSPLPGSAAEARRVRELWGSAGGGGGGPVKMLTGREASEVNLTRAATGKQVLHLATHAFFVPSRCDGRVNAGAVAPKPGAAGGRLQAGTPLRVSGLALSGANRRKSARSAEDDGLLTAEEISSLDLDGVEWVVLSGCETGVGLARAGEGILGLRRSFQVAGARTLVLSLWPVSDNDTQSWMAGLYRARATGATTCEAVNAASRRIVEARRKAGVTAHPFFWGAFVAAGDWR